MKEENGHSVEGGALRLAYLVSRYPAVHHTFILREIRKLRALGFEIEVISIDAPDRAPERLAEDEREEAARTFHVKPVGLVGAATRHAATLAARPLSYLRGLLYALSLGRGEPRATLRHALYFAEAVVVGRRMAEKRLAHLHTHFSSTVALMVKKVFPVTFSMTIHGPGEFENPAPFHLAEKVREASFVCAISNFARSQLMMRSRHDDWPKIEVAPLGIDPSVFAPRPHRESPEVFEVICVGRLAAVKAQHVLVRAIERLVSEGRQVVLRLVGDGPDRASLEREVAARGLREHVRFEGWRNQDEVRELYRRADIFALASFAEGVPVVLMEAMAMEIPCVATHVNGVPELIRHPSDGLLVAPSDDEALARAIGFLMDEAPLRRRMGASARRRVAARYDLARNTELLADIFRRRLGAETATVRGDDPDRAPSAERATEDARAVV